MFSEFNKFAKSDILLYDLHFSIAIANAKKTFNEVLARFISAIATLDFQDCYKISNFWRTLNESLCFQMANDKTYTWWSEYV